MIRAPVLRRPATPRQLLYACRHLVANYAAPGWWPARTPFEVMVGAVLVQNTRWTNVERAIDRLRECSWLSPSALAKARPQQLALQIRPAGCQTVKARRLIALSRWLLAAGGLDALRSRPTATVRAQMLSVHGIGPETADAILCFALQRPVFIADRYARRLLGRLGLLDSATVAAYEPCRTRVEAWLRWPVSRLQALHGAIVRLCQGVCRRVPQCANCTLRRRCKYFIEEYQIKI